MTYKVNWDGAYETWKKSKFSQKKFYYSKEFKKFLRPGRMPTEATFQSHFRSIRKKLESEAVNLAPKQQPKETKQQIEVIDSQEVNVVDADKYRPNKLGKLLFKQNIRIRRLRKIAVRLPDGTAVEFETGDPELLVLQMIAVFKGERL